MEILVVDDDRCSRASVVWFLREQGHAVTECDNARQALAEWKQADYPLVLSDIQMPDMSGIELAEAITTQPDGWRTDVVLFTGFGDMQTAVAALRAGAYDYLLKPVDARELAAVVRRVAEHQALLRENKELTENFDAQVRLATSSTEQELNRMRKIVAENILGTIGFFSEKMRTIVEMAQRYHEDRSLIVLIQGETGVGKEVIARIIHYGSQLKSFAGPLVELNCAAIPHNLFETELFGYEGGAFSGSLSRGQKGKLDAAAGGTIFLDEITELLPEMQAKLLRVIETREYYRVGGLKKIRADIRIICATNVDLGKRLETGSFRSDLYYRLKVGHLVIPPLRDRREEIVPLAELFLQEFARNKKKRFTAIAGDARQLLEAYSWPGNVRELRNVIEWAVFMYDDDKLRSSHVVSITTGSAAVPAGAAPGNTAGENIVLPLPPGGLSIKEYNNLIIQAVLEAHDGNQTAAARYLDMSLRAFCYRLEKMCQRAATEKIT